MPVRQDLQSVMVIGSGPVVIGQAAEFDYAGTQACVALREEGLRVVLINSNPATIMTDGEMADRVYLEPLTVESAAAVIAKERPQGLVATLGGQVGLNLAVALADAGVLDRYGVEILGTQLPAIRKAEDRELFKATMVQISEPVPESKIIHTLAEAGAFAGQIGLPLIVRPAYTLGGSGGGIANTPDDLREIVRRGLRMSPIGQVLLERSLYGWKEIEYEVMRDAGDRCISVCNMENLDPVGVHTGDSIVVAPSQTLNDRDFQRLRAAAFHIVRAIGVQGGCNVQFALDPNSDQYFVIEVNPRVSRSSALASKATGYPIAKVAAKIAVGLGLDEIKNPVTGTTTAFFEPTLDYCVMKIPRWPFDKFSTADRRLGTQMKATGEVMAIDRTFEGALQKAVRSLDLGLDGLAAPEALPDDQLDQAVIKADDRRLLFLAEALRRGRTIPALAQATGVDPWFLRKILNIVEAEREVAAGRIDLFRLKRLGFSDARLGSLSGAGEAAVRRMRVRTGIRPSYKMVDTCAAEFEATTPYFYSAYGGENESAPDQRPCVIVLGSGPIRIGQGIEFDYGSVHAVWALRKAGLRAVIINNNPETVSTDFSTADRLYFEPLTFEDVMNVIDLEQPVGVLCQFGGQTAVNLAVPLHRAGVNVLGTTPEGMDRAEDRGLFEDVLESLHISRPAGGAAASLPEAEVIAERVGFPVLVRPSYVLGGRAMEICYDPDDLRAYVQSAARVTPEHPLLIDHYIPGREVEVDAVSDGGSVLIPGILEHVERAGVHSGDSIAVYPPHSLSAAVKAQIARQTLDLARALGIVGLLNIQFVVDGEEVHVLELNPRSSRTVPFMTKVTGVPMVAAAVRATLRESLEAQGYDCPGGICLPPDPGFVACKMPVFSWAKLHDVDTALGPEMKSTGEVMGIGRTYPEALRKGFLACGLGVPVPATALVAIAERDKSEALPVVRALVQAGLRIVATPGTAESLREAGVAAETLTAAEAMEAVRSGSINLLVNTLTRGRQRDSDGFRLRRAATELGVPVLTSLDTAGALGLALGTAGDDVPPPWALQDYAVPVRT
ncbi:MAG TPA: carbamoyl-phosphate synthase large subunit [Bacillota bacterium]|nr:carbamoyl-phosphate synthase large subunit [Bacillota bacterium]